MVRRKEIRYDSNSSKIKNEIQTKEKHVFQNQIRSDSFLTRWRNAI